MGLCCESALFVCIVVFLIPVILRRNRLAEDQEKGGRKSIHIPRYVSVPDQKEQLIIGMIN